MLLLPLLLGLEHRMRPTKIMMLVPAKEQKRSTRSTASLPNGSTGRNSSTRSSGKGLTIRPGNRSQSEEHVQHWKTGWLRRRSVRRRTPKKVRMTTLTTTRKSKTPPTRIPPTPGGGRSSARGRVTPTPATRAHPNRRRKRRMTVRTPSTFPRVDAVDAAGPSVPGLHLRRGHSIPGRWSCWRRIWPT